VTGVQTCALPDLASQKALEQFNRAAGLKLDVQVATLETLDVVRGKSARVCPLVCEHGQRADGERCVRITCKAGYEVSDDNTCEKIEVKKPAARSQASSNDKPAKPDLAAKPDGPVTTAGRNFQERYAECARKLHAQMGTRMTHGGAAVPVASFHAVNACAMNGG